MLNQEKQRFERYALPVAGGIVGTAAISQPAQAQSAGGIADVSTMVTTLGTVAGAVVTVVLFAMGVRLAIKIVNRLTVKG
jgi:hypothetical protein